MIASVYFLTCVIAFAPQSGNASIRSPALSSEIVITTTSRLAGAVHSLTWNGKEFIDSLDHGRQLQSACSFDCGKSNFWAECYNPTEAGSRRDHVGPRSTSRLWAISATGSRLTSLSQMAFWLAPGEKSSERPALNQRRLSSHLLRKSIQIGYHGFPNAIEYRVNFTVPPGELHHLAQFEALTGYMPPEFNRFYAFDRKRKELNPLTEGPGEQPNPIVFSTESGSHAMGAIVLDPTPEGMRGPGYGRWKFHAEKVVKWNVVFRKHDNSGIAAGDYPFRIIVAIGTREDVRKTFSELTN